LAGVTERADRPVAEPVPERCTDWGLVESLSDTISWPDLVPMAVGLNVTLMVQECPATTEFPQLFVCAKSPSVVMLNNVNAVLRWFVRLTVLTPLVDPTT
jgi:hypothetical protein